MQKIGFGRRAELAFALALTVIVAVACTPTQVGIQARFPANYPEAAELHRLAIGDFDGRGSDAFEASLRAEIANAVFDGAPTFTVLSATGGEPVSAARRARADGVIFGQTDVDGGYENYLVDQQRCVAYNRHNTCIQYQNYQVPCTRRTITVNASPQVVRVADSRLVYAQQRSASSETHWCQGEQRQLSDDAMIGGAINAIVQQVRRDIAPYNAVLNATIIERHDGLPRDMAAQFDQAVAQAQANNVGEACRLWTAVAAGQPNHPWTTYNLGVCAEATGDYQTALQRYQSAQQLGGGSDRTVAASISRVQRVMGAEQQLAVAEQQRQEAAQAEAERAATAARQAEAARAARRADLVARYGASTADSILAGRVTIGMTADQVIAALGQPTSRENLPPTDMIWYYGSRRISFTNGRVAAIRN